MSHLTPPEHSTHSTTSPSPALTPKESTQSSHHTHTPASPTQTAVDIHGQSPEQKWARAEEAPTQPIADEAAREEGLKGAEIKLSQGRKWFLLFVFSVAQYLDIASYSGLFVFTEPMLNDLDILYESSSWIITAYSVTFAAFLLLWGRVSDLYSAKPVFAYGFLGLGLTNLIISFLPEQYSYFIFRAISGIFGAATIPSAFRLILAIFEPSELQVALSLFGLSGALANVTGLVIAGFFGFITAGGQQAAWRWFFRMICIVIVPFSFAAFTLVPKTRGDRAEECSQREKFKRLDLVGCFAMLVSIILLILGLTLGASYGFKTAKFLVPFLLSWPIFVGFFIWEAKLPDGYALIPPSFWKIPNMTLLIVFAMGIYPWWAVNQLPIVQTLEVIYGEKPIIVAVRLLPQGIAALAVAMVIPPILQKLASPRIPIALGMIVGAGAYLLFIYSRGSFIHNDYWRWLFPAFIIGSGGAMAAFLSVNITVMTTAPPASSGVAGAMLQVALQVGAVVGLSVQAGLFTLKPGNFRNYSNVQASFWFQFGWCLFNLIIFLVFFRPGRAAEGSELAQQISKNKGEVEKRPEGETV